MLPILPNIIEFNSKECSKPSGHLYLNTRLLNESLNSLRHVPSSVITCYFILRAVGKTWCMQLYEPNPASVLSWTGNSTITQQKQFNAEAETNGNLVNSTRNFVMLATNVGCLSLETLNDPDVNLKGFPLRLQVQVKDEDLI